MNRARRDQKRHEAQLTQIAHDLEGIKALAPFITDEHRFQQLLHAVDPALRTRVEAQIRPYLPFTTKNGQKTTDMQH